MDFVKHSDSDGFQIKYSIVFSSSIILESVEKNVRNFMHSAGVESSSVLIGQHNFGYIFD